MGFLSSYHSPTIWAVVFVCRYQFVIKNVCEMRNKFVFVVLSF
jgi:hypothetical protein